MAPDQALDDQIAGLYALELDSFVAERNELAKRLRAEGARERAEAVGKLRKPSVAAWAVNRAVRVDPGAARQVAEAGERLAAAQQQALTGKGPRALREASAAEGEAIEALLAVLRDASPELGPQVLDRARRTIRAIAGDDALRERFLAGRLSEDAEAIGLGGDPSAQPTPRRSDAKQSRGKKPAADAKRRRAVERRVERARSELEIADSELETARADLNEARREREGAERALDAAARALKRAEHKAERRRTALDEAREALKT